MSKKVLACNGFQEIRLAFIKFNTKKNRQWSVGSITTLSVLIWGLSTMDSNYVASRVYFDEARDYSQIPFDELDAINVCRAETRKRFGSSLVRLTLNSHSTRFDDRTRIYKMFMVADVGSLRNFEEMAVHCFVDPSEYTIDHYRTFSTKQRSLVDRARGIFGL